ncbi:MAG: adenylyltransferase/cytidyltransferase family protein [Planctomycetaceae bacterium]|nr:adenylyltransferase/cytidyltransferase family protein [Planctomycetaceae bacterium]
MSLSLDLTQPVNLIQSSQVVEQHQELTGVAVFPGSFNPLHEGHRQLCRAAASLLRTPVIFEISVANVQKADLTSAEVSRRLQQFRDVSVAVTRAPLFADKSRLFPGCPFVVGFDTAERIIDPAFYGGSADACRDALQKLYDAGHRFLVAGRLCPQRQRFLNLADLRMAEKFRCLFQEIPETHFRNDVSSSQLRQKQRPCGESLS